MMEVRRRKGRMALENGDYVRVDDGRIARVRQKTGDMIKVKVRRTTSDTHQFLLLKASELERVPCPKGWMSPEGYRRYLRVTLRKMRQRQERGT